MGGGETGSGGPCGMIQKSQLISTAWRVRFETPGLGILHMFFAMFSIQRVLFGIGYLCIATMATRSSASVFQRQAGTCAWLILKMLCILVKFQAYHV